MENGEEKMAEGPISRLLSVMAALRTPVSGCEWDLKQTCASIAPHTIEEAFEVAEAIERGDWDDLKDELGDLLFNVVYHAQIAQELGQFDFASVATVAADKMVRRHPHVFGPKDDALSQSARRDLGATWDAIKAAEKTKPQNLKPSSMLDDVAAGLPPFIRAVKLQKRARNAGFDWPDFTQVLAKVDEELAELKAELGQDAEVNRGAVFEEFGDLLFALTEIAWRRGFDPEAALRAANTKFTQRFQHMERALAQQNITAQDLPFEGLMALWREAKLSNKPQN